MLDANQRHAAARHDPFLDRGTSGVQRILDAGLLFLHLGLGGSADVNDGNTSGQLGEPLLKLLAVVVRGGLVDRRTDLGNAALDRVGLPLAVDDGGVVLVDHHPLGLTEIGQRGVLELEADFLADHVAAGENGDVAQHFLAAVTEARRLDGGDLEGAAQLVDDQRGQRLALDVLGDDHERLARLGHLLEHREEFLHRGDLLVVDEDVGRVHRGFHRLGVGNEVGREVAAIELHPVDRLQGGLEALRLLDRDDALLADLLHRLGDQLADLRITVGRDGADLGDVLLAVGRDREILERGDERLDGLVDAPLELHRVRTRGDVLEPFTKDRLRQHGGGGGAVAGQIGGLGGDLLDHLGAHVLDRVGELDLLGHRDAVLGHGRGAELLVDHDVAPLGAEGHLDRLGESVNALLQLRASVHVEEEFLCCHCFSLQSIGRGSAELGEDVRGLDDDDLISTHRVRRPAVLPVNHLVADLEVDRHPRTLFDPARTDGDDFTHRRLFLGGVGDVEAAAHRLGLIGGENHHAILEGGDLELGLRGRHLFLPPNSNELLIVNCQWNHLALNRAECQA